MLSMLAEGAPPGVRGRLVSKGRYSRWLHIETHVRQWAIRQAARAKITSIRNELVEATRG